MIRNLPMNASEEHQSNEEEVPSQPNRILVVDDEEVIRTLLREILVGEGYEVTTAADGQEAIDFLEREQVDLVMTDLVMPRVNGVEVIRASKRVNPRCPVIVVTGYPSVETVVRVTRLGAADYITKPFNVDVVKITVAKLLAMSENVQESNPAEGDDPDPQPDPPD